VEEDMGKLMTVFGIGLGYVLGARAGRERFEQIKQAAAKVAQRPEVQQTRERIVTAASDKLQHSGPGMRLPAGVKQRAADAAAKLRNSSPDAGSAKGGDAPPD